MKTEKGLGACMNTHPSWTGSCERAYYHSGLCRGRVSWGKATWDMYEKAGVLKPYSNHPVREEQWALIEENKTKRERKFLGLSKQ